MNNDEKNDDVVGSSSSSIREEINPERLTELTAKAEKRFKLANLAVRLAKAVDDYGEPWVAAALDLPRLRTWGGVLGTLKNWRVEGGPPVQARPQAFDPAAWLGRVTALGIAFGAVDGEVRMSEAVHSPGWSKGGLGSELWGQFQRYKAEIKAHVLAGGATAAVYNRRA